MQTTPSYAGFSMLVAKIVMSSPHARFPNRHLTGAAQDNLLNVSLPENILPAWTPFVLQSLVKNIAKAHTDTTVCGALETSSWSAIVSTLPCVCRSYYAWISMSHKRKEQKQFSFFPTRFVQQFGPSCCFGAVECTYAKIVALSRCYNKNNSIYGAYCTGICNGRKPAVLDVE